VLRFFIFVSLSCTSLISAAQIKVNSSKPITLEYRSKVWNKHPTQLDDAFILMRDSESKKMVRVQLQETDLNSDLFVGHYSVTFGQQDLTPEVYFPPQEMMKNSEQISKLENYIKDGSLIRKPYFVHEEGKGNYIITIFDTKEQAIQALEDYRKLRLQVKSPVGQAALEAQALAAKAREQKEKMTLEQQQNEERARLEAEEKKKQEALRLQQEQLNAAEKARRAAQAKQLAAQGMEAYKKANYTEAEPKFAKAIELDPSNTAFYFQYGVTLYRNANYNKSLVILNLAKGAEVNAAERDFFIASDYMKLKENDNAIRHYEAAKSSTDKNLSAGAAFYAGVLQYQTEKYDLAKANFEFVLDNSGDPTLDKQAETYIEQIANVIAFKKEQQKKFILSLNGGLMYDSNILAIAKSQLDQQTELAGYRWSYGASFEYRPLYTYVHDFSVIASASDMYSTNSKFAAEKTFQDTDPLSFSIHAPYHYKGKVFDKGYQMTLNPGYETTMMNADAEGSREVILYSTVLKNDHTFVMNNTWFATYSLELRSDVSKIAATEGTADDLTATKIGLSTTQTFFQNDKKTEAWIGEMGASQNTAKGDNATYTRFDFAATYMSPWKWDTTWTARMALYYADYNKHTVGRKDTDSSITLGLLKPITETFSTSLTGTYTNNSSTLDSSDYNKYVVMTMFSWTTSL
jgi:hypothetical protein